MESNLLGIYGEHLAAKFLVKNKFKIYSTNFKTKAGEIDIIAYKKPGLHFIEVKTRKVGSMLPPSTAVDLKKQQNIKSVASVYINKTNFKKEVHYDIVEILLDGNIVAGINFIPDAF